MKRTLSIILSLLMIISTISFMPFEVFADESGVCGDGVSYTYSSSAKTLEITGNGAMYDFSPENHAPFAALSDDVESIYIREGVTHVGDYAFECFSKLKDVTIEDTVEDIGVAAFSCCSYLERVSLSESLTTIAAAAFDDCQDLADLQIPDSVTYIGNSAFKYCYLNSLYLGTGVETIESEAFAYCYLDALELPDSLETIGLGAFAGNSMWEVILPSSLNSIGLGVFKNCNNLNSVYYCGDRETFDTLLEDSEYSSTFDSFIYFTEGTCGENIEYALDLGNGTLYLYGYGDMEDYEGPYTSPFAGNTKIETIDFSDGISHIGSYAFARCSGLKEIDTAEVHSVGNYAFIDCTGIEKATLNSSVNEFGEGVFHSCSSLKTVDFGAYADILPYDFWNCTSLESITLSPAVELVCMNSFNGSNENFTVTAYCHTNGIEEAILDGTNRKWEKLHYETSAEVTPATFDKDGLRDEYCATCGDPTGEYIIYQLKTASLSNTSYTYNGNAKKPTVTVKDRKGKTLKKDRDYTVKYSDNTKVGTAKAVITFKGDYKGTKTLKFKINPKGTALSKVTKGKKSFTAEWKKQSTQTTGYQLQYSTSSSFPSSSKTVTVSSTKTLKKTVENLKSKKKYYVRIRTYKTVNKTKYYSAWSGKKAVTTK